MTSGAPRVTAVTERATAEPPESAESAAWLDEGAIVTDWPHR